MQQPSGFFIMKMQERTLIARTALPVFTGGERKGHPFGCPFGYWNIFQISFVGAGTGRICYIFLSVVKKY